MIWIFQGDSKRVIESSNGFLEGHTVLSDVSLGLLALPFKTHGNIIVCAELAGPTVPSSPTRCFLARPVERLVGHIACENSDRHMASHCYLSASSGLPVAVGSTEGLGVSLDRCILWCK